MRIGIVTGEYPPMHGGIGAYTHILAHHLKAQSVDVFIFSSNQAQTTNNEIALENSISSWNMTSLWAIKRWAGEKKIDVLNLQFQTAAFGMSPWIHLLPHVAAVPVVTTFHDLRHPYLFPKAGTLRDWFVMHLAKQSRGVIVTNHEDYQLLSLIENKVLIPIGSNIQQALPPKFDAALWRHKAGAQANDYLIAYFGLLNQTKGLETLLASMKQLLERGVPVRLVVVGGGIGSSDPSNSLYAKNLYSLIQNLSIESLIHWTGYLENEEDVGSYLSASDIIALPFTDGASYRRGSLMAAIQYECAIVSTEPRIEIPAFRNGENMLLVTQSDVKELTEALISVWQSPVLQQQLRQGAKMLKQVFEWPSISQQTLAFLERVRSD